MNADPAANATTRRRSLWSGISGSGSDKNAGMSGEHAVERRTGRRGRPSKGPRYAQTIRFPGPLRDVIEEARAGSGYDNVNDFVVAMLQEAAAAGIFHAAEPSGQDRLPLSA
jgi:hypothetical protein